MTFYASYGASIAASPFVNAFYSAWLKLDMQISYWATIASLGVMNYIILKFTMGSKQESIKQEEVKYEVVPVTQEIELSGFESETSDIGYDFSDQSVCSIKIE